MNNTRRFVSVYSRSCAVRIGWSTPYQTRSNTSPSPIPAVQTNTDLPTKRYFIQDGYSTGSRCRVGDRAKTWRTAAVPGPLAARVSHTSFKHQTQTSYVFCSPTCTNEHYVGLTCHDVYTRTHLMFIYIYICITSINKSVVDQNRYFCVLLVKFPWTLPRRMYYSKRSDYAATKKITHMGFCCLPFEVFTCENRLCRRSCTRCNVCNYHGRDVQSPRTSRRCVSDGFRYENEFSELFEKNNYRIPFERFCFEQLDFDSTLSCRRQILRIGKNNQTFFKSTPLSLSFRHCVFHKYVWAITVSLFSQIVQWLCANKSIRFQSLPCNCGQYYRR